MKKIDIIFIDGLDSKLPVSSYLTFLFPLSAIMKKYNFSFAILNLHTLRKYSINAN
jgi:hypothetical protein